MPETVNNKEMIPLEHYMDAYRNTDPHQMSQKSQTAYNEDLQSFRITFLGREYDISWPEFTIKAADGISGPSPLLDTNQAKILVVRYLLEGSALPSTGKDLTYREVPWGEVYYRQFSGRCLSRMAFGYGKRIDEFRRGMKLLGAKPIPDSDAGFAITVFPGYTVKLLLWQGDEDFPPSAQILFSDNFAAAFHAEDLVVVSEVVLNALKTVLR